MRLLALCCALCHALALRVPQPLPPHHDVATNSGVVRGYLVPRPPHYAFLGLPYARPPAVQARFKAAETPVRWDGVFEATYRVRCAQPGQRGDAACLVLNVFAPERATSRPVLVHLHAGHFATGWGSHSAPPRLLNLGFVVVTLNYRLGADGFLCLGTSAAPGNAGLKDQVAALAWVHENIDKFGGDASQVTLYGTSTGAAAAELLLLSGAIDGFVQRLILESGSALAPTSLSSDPVATAMDVATALGYENDGNITNDDLGVFYQNIAVAKTVNYSNRFAPCVENLAEYYSALLIKDPKEILQRGMFKPVPLLIVYSKEKILDDDDMFHNIPNSFEDLLPNNLEFQSDETKLRIGEQVKESYFDELQTDAGIIENFENYINDVFTVYPIVKSATLHVASGSPVYLMEFVPHDGSNTIFEYVFGKEVFSEEEELIAEKLVTMWSNFLLYSDPTPLQTTLLPVVWLPITFRVRNEKPDISTASCLVFNSGQISMSMGMPSSGYTLPVWDHIYDNFYKSHTPKLELSESEVMLYNAEIAFISKLSQELPGVRGDNNAKKHDEMKSDNNVSVENGSGESDNSDGSEIENVTDENAAGAGDGSDFIEDDETGYIGGAGNEWMHIGE
ncbi:juvenile hormone esterase-like [Cydia pomonella]|uniref:juvenile hormone esterase-like n=1 Tax=Cydia pomonella TaxID=82600 RepID=UPI002ADD4377|nr:juvenile hormone esterase-like [Cydia pomonella]XP_061721408.1 juvenile hormone esterase-like [Cydia pomonella]